MSETAIQSGPDGDIPETPPPAPPVAASAANGQAFRLSGDPPRVTRLSRKALAILGLSVGLGIGGALLYALQPRQPALPKNLYEGESGNKAEMVTSAPASYDKVAKLGAALPGDLGGPILHAQINGQAVPVPPMGMQAAPPSDLRATTGGQARELVMQERDSARTSRLFLAGAGGADAVAPALAAASDGIAEVQHTGDAIGSGSSAPTGKRAFLDNRSGRITVSAERIADPVSPNILQAGSIIPAALITAIHSDLPGQITAQVTQNVYDSPTGRIVLIPQGSRLIGEYDSDISAGQNRVLLVWDRLILPGGRSILLDRLPGTDASGMAGLKDRTNYHWGDMLKAAAISTLLGVGAELTTDSDDPLTRALRAGGQDTINQTGRQVVQSALNVPPTLTIRAGTPLRVILTRDIVLENTGERK